MIDHDPAICVELIRVARRDAPYVARRYNFWEELSAVLTMGITIRTANWLVFRLPPEETAAFGRAMLNLETCANQLEAAGRALDSCNEAFRQAREQWSVERDLAMSAAADKNAVLAEVTAERDALRDENERLRQLFRSAREVTEVHADIRKGLLIGTAGDLAGPLHRLASALASIPRPDGTGEGR